jgi:UDP-N-acetylglucosamine 2-epimerase (non-hydrolysing)
MLLIAFGTRPEWIKIKPVLDKINGIIPFKLVFTGQHLDLINAESLKSYTVEHILIEDISNRLDDIAISILQHGNAIYDGVKYVMVQGDTTSAFAIALGAFNRKIPIIHLEAGLRSWDMKNPYPEEFNRVTISNMADIHLCPTEDNALNIRLKHRGQTYVVGNTVLDNLVHLKPTIEDIVFITMHRRENLPIMDKWFIAINELAKQNPNLKFIFPMHPNPEIKKHKDLLTHVQVTEPLSYEVCLEYLRTCCLVITDSGGLQEESCFLKKKCIVCRESTERSEGENTFAFLSWTPDHLESVFMNLKLEMVDMPCPYGDGRASDKILNILRSIL